MKHLAVFGTLVLVGGLFFACSEGEDDDSNTGGTSATGGASNTGGGSSTGGSSTGGDSGTGGSGSGDLSSCIVFDADFGDDMCWNSDYTDEDECAEADGDWGTSSCAEEELTTECPDSVWVEDGVDCPSQTEAVCTYYFDEYSLEVCWTDTQADCVLVAGAWDGEVTSCADYGFDVYCDGYDYWAESEDDCP